MRIIAFLLTQSITIAVAAQTAVTIARQYANSVVTILSEDANHQSLALGSGFIVGNGQVATNYHVIEGAKYATIVTSTGTKITVEGVLAHSAKHDLAILSAPTLMNAVTISSDSVQIGERVYAIGSPEGLSNSLSEGIVSGKRILDGNWLIQITAPISPGSSGGPVINERGVVVGVAVGAISSGQNLNFAIPAKQLSTLLSSQLTLKPLSQLIPRKTPAAVGGPNRTTSGEAITITNLDFDAFEYYTGINPITGHYLEGISLQNNTGRTIGRVKVLLILYNSSGVPIDNLMMVLCKSGQSRPILDYTDCKGIAPGLAMYYELSTMRINSSESKRILERRKGEKLEIRIIDFEFRKE